MQKITDTGAAERAPMTSRGLMLVAEWRDIVRRAWSIKLIVAAFVLTGFETALPLIDGYIDIPRGVFATASGLATAGAFVARLLAQKDLPNV
jgi:hypothetical protein